MKISVIGGGNMGGAIVKGMHRRGLTALHEVSVADVNALRLSELSLACPSIRITDDLQTIVADADMVVLAVKPWLYADVIGRMKGVFDVERRMLVSIAAGVSLADLRSLFEVDSSKSALLFRVMPNIAIEYCESINFIASECEDEAPVLAVKELFSDLGQVMVLQESQFGAATALGSCGIAFAMRYVRASSTAGLELGLTSSQSQEVMVRTLRGVVALLESSDRHLESLIDSVCTPGGVTIKGLNKMEEEGFTRAVQAGIRAVR